MSSLNFIGSDPGAVKYGNFINYYKFHPAKDRLMGFPTHIWLQDEGQKFCCLDVGCNSGELTQAIWEFISQHVKFNSSTSESEDEMKSMMIDKRPAVSNTECFMLAMDLDHVLITRAIESNSRKSHISYVVCNFMNEDEVVTSVKNFCDDKLQEKYLLQCFDAVFLLSITMWIHINYGDDGFQKLLQRAASLSRNLVIVEPQLWKSYTAANRCTRSGGEGFSLLSKLKLRDDAAIENELDRVLTECQFKKIDESEKLKWDRKILFYQRCSS